MAVRVDRVFVVWVRIELALVTVTPLIRTHYLNNNEAVVKYFLIQRLRGLIILYSWMGMRARIYLTLVGVILKLGLAPLHYWVPEVFKNSSYPLVFVLSTAIKIPGLVLLSIRVRRLAWRLIIIRVLVGRAAGVYSSNLKVLLAYSRVVHTGWLSPLTKFPSRWVIYFRLYSLMVASLLQQFNSLNLKTLGQLSYTPLRQRLPIALRVISLSGLPPTLGFRLKWVLISTLSRFYIALVVLMPLIAIRVYFYTQILFQIILQVRYFNINGMVGPYIVLSCLIQRLGLTGLVMFTL
jgi:NADH:ubiquinone oxidoreductase subunit 2 (subunit N)